MLTEHRFLGLLILLTRPVDRNKHVSINTTDDRRVFIIIISNIRVKVGIGITKYKTKRISDLSMPELSIESIGKFVALGGTFQSHQDEKDRTYRWPDSWVVPSESVIGNNESIEIPKKVDKIKPGAELTAVIGESIYQANKQQAWDAIKGFTISNDVTASGDWPGWSDPDHGMITGVGYKLFPTFSPILNKYTSKGKKSDYADLKIEVRVDGESAVSGSTNQLAFSIPEMISFASNICKLRENDVVALGDPGNPTRFLDDAESVTCEIEDIGELSNPIERI